MAVVKIIQALAPEKDQQTNGLPSVPLSAERGQYRCPQCHSTQAWVWKKGIPVIDNLMKLIGFDLLTCRSCGTRFYAN